LASKSGKPQERIRMTFRLNEGFDDDELPERYVAALLVIAKGKEISVEEAHEEVSDTLDAIYQEGLEIKVDLDSDKKQTKH